MIWIMKDKSPAPFVISSTTRFSCKDCYILLHIRPTERSESEDITTPTLDFLENFASAVSVVDFLSPLPLPQQLADHQLFCQVYVCAGTECSKDLQTFGLAKGFLLRRYLSAEKDRQFAYNLHRWAGFPRLADALSDSITPHNRTLSFDFSRTFHTSLILEPFKSSPLFRDCIGSRSTAWRAVPVLNIASEPEDEEADKSRESSGSENSRKDVTARVCRQLSRHRSSQSMMMADIKSRENDEEDCERQELRVPKLLMRSQSTGTNNRGQIMSLSLDMRAVDTSNLRDPDSPASIKIIPSSDSESSAQEQPEDSTPRGFPKSKLPLVIPNSPPPGESPYPGAPSERKEIQSKRDKMHFYARDCTSVNDFISVGGRLVAQNYDLLVSKGVTHVLNCVGDVCENYHEGKLKYLKYYLLDSSGEDITCIVYDTYRFVEDARTSSGRVFIHCQQGVSRSTIVTISYLILHLAKDYEDCYEMVRAARQVCRPNMGFMSQLLAWQKRINGTSTRSNYLYRIASHCSRDRMRVVAKWCEVTKHTSLDSRTVFLLHTPSKIIIWVGRGCQIQDYFIEIAKNHLACLQRFEHGSHKVHIIYEANPVCTDVAVEFWNLVDCPSKELAIPINPEYDSDYEPYMPKELKILKEKLVVLRLERSYETAMRARGFTNDGCPPTNPGDGSSAMNETVGMEMDAGVPPAPETEAAEDDADDDVKPLVSMNALENGNIINDVQSALYIISESGLEELKNFEMDELSDDAAYILTIEGESDFELEVHVWIGRQFRLPEAFALDSQAFVEYEQAELLRILAKRYRQKITVKSLKLQTQGNETDAFWAGFVHG